MSYRQKWVYKDGELIEWADYISGKESVAVHAVKQDTIEAQISHADGKMYDSRSQMLRAAKRAGCIEIGNEDPSRWVKPREADPRIRREIIGNVVRDYLS